MAFSSLARRNGVPATLAEATDVLNRQQVPRLAEMILSRLPAGGTAGIAGLSYKPDTEVTEESQGLLLAQHLLSRDVNVVVYDPAAMDSTRGADGRRHIRDLPGGLCPPGRCAGDHHSLAEFQTLSADAMSPVNGRRKTLIDCWRILTRANFDGSLTTSRWAWDRTASRQPRWNNRARCARRHEETEA